MLQVDIDKITPVTEARDNLNKIVDEVDNTDVMHVLTKNGTPVAVIVGVNHLEKLTGEPLPGATAGSAAGQNDDKNQSADQTDKKEDQPKDLAKSDDSLKDNLPENEDTKEVDSTATKPIEPVAANDKLETIENAMPSADSTIAVKDDKPDNTPPQITPSDNTDDKTGEQQTAPTSQNEPIMPAAQPTPADTNDDLFSDFDDQPPVAAAEATGKKSIFDDDLPDDTNLSPTTPLKTGAIPSEPTPTEPMTASSAAPAPEVDNTNVTNSPEPTEAEPVAPNPVNEPSSDQAVNEPEKMNYNDFIAPPVGPGLTGQPETGDQPLTTPESTDNEPSPAIPSVGPDTSADSPASSPAADPTDNLSHPNYTFDQNQNNAANGNTDTSFPPPANPAP